MSYRAAEGRYDDISYRYCGRSGLQLPTVSLGLWQHCFEVTLVHELVTTSFDRGMTHFDLANNYGPPPGAAEESMGKVLARELGAYRDELVIATKAGYDMWPGPYGDFGSRKYLLASLDQSLQRLGLDYVDIFYHHRPDPNTPLEETIGALSDIVRQGKSIYAGISNYRGDLIRKAADIARELRLPLIINQVKYNMIDRGPEEDVIPVCESEGQSMIAFSPLAQGLLTGRYLDGIPDDSRAAKGMNDLGNRIDEAILTRVRTLNEIAEARGQTLAQMALAWILRHDGVVSVIIGASKPSQVIDCVGATQADPLSEEELGHIEAVLSG
ncbi:MAG: aldo/keto reductase [Candidatus Latescibacterota bacterium]|nr:aldo/keto reductase [Candidatus Latescibacterota bacterium]